MANDPRVFFAAERTLLAWVRTGISIQGVGFLVAKFGLFLQLMGYRGWTVVGQHVSLLVGVTFVLTGSGSIAWAAWQNRQFLATLPADQRPEGYVLHSGRGLANLIAALGLLLALYLALTSEATPLAAGVTVPPA